MSLQFRQTSVCDPQTSQRSACGPGRSLSCWIVRRFGRAGRGSSSLDTPQHIELRRPRNA